MGNMIKKPFTLDPFGLFKGPKPPTAPPPPPTPPDLGSVLAGKRTSNAPPLGGTFLTGSLFDQKPSTTGGKTLLGQ